MALSIRKETSGNISIVQYPGRPAVLALRAVGIDNVASLYAYLKRGDCVEIIDFQIYPYKEEEPSTLFVEAPLLISISGNANPVLSMP